MTAGTAEVRDSAGAPTESYVYDVFGVLRSPEPSGAKTDRRFTGEQADVPVLRSPYYLRARHYDPGLGRFVQKDLLRAPNRYTYGFDDPVNTIDPSGMWGVHIHLPKPSLTAISEWTQKQVVDPVVHTTRSIVNNIGYVDLNGTACWQGTCATLGLQLSPSQGIHPYAGVGVGYGAGLSLTYAPGQRITTGANCGVQVSYGEFSAQAGSAGLKLGKEGVVRGSVYGEVGTGVGLVEAATCTWIL